MGKKILLFALVLIVLPILVSSESCTFTKGTCTGNTIGFAFSETNSHYFNSDFSEAYKICCNDISLSGDNTSFYLYQETNSHVSRDEIDGGYSVNLNQTCSFSSDCGDSTCVFETYAATNSHIAICGSGLSNKLCCGNSEDYVCGNNIIEPGEQCDGHLNCVDCNCYVEGGTSSLLLDENNHNLTHSLINGNYYAYDNSNQNKRAHGCCVPSLDEFWICVYDPFLGELSCKCDDTFDPVSCTGTMPTGEAYVVGQELYGDPNHEPKSWTYTSNTNLLSCQFTCADGFEWNEDNQICQEAECDIQTGCEEGQCVTIEQLSAPHEAQANTTIQVVCEVTNSEVNYIKASLGNQNCEFTSWGESHRAFFNCNTGEEGEKEIKCFVDGEEPCNDEKTKNILVTENTCSSYNEESSCDSNSCIWISNFCDDNKYYSPADPDGVCISENPTYSCNYENCNAECDGNGNFVGGNYCSDHNETYYEVDWLTCNNNCTINVSGCPYCGDGIVHSTLNEECDSVDNCVNCQCEEGYVPVSGGNNCVQEQQSICGNGILEGDEECDDGNTNDGDGCSSVCKVECGYSCDRNSVCTLNDEICGSGRDEDCDGFIDYKDDDCSVEIFDLEVSNTCPFYGEMINVYSDVNIINPCTGVSIDGMKCDFKDWDRDNVKAIFECNVKTNTFADTCSSGDTINLFNFIDNSCIQIGDNITQELRVLESPCTSLNEAQCGSETDCEWCSEPNCQESLYQVNYGTCVSNGNCPARKCSVPNCNAECDSNEYNLDFDNNNDGIVDCNDFGFNNGFLSCNNCEIDINSCFNEDAQCGNNICEEDELFSCPEDCLDPGECFHPDDNDKCNVLLNETNIIEFINDGNCIKDYKACCTTEECGVEGYYYESISLIIS